MIFTTILQKMLKQDLTFQTMNQNAIPLRDHCLKEQIKKVIGLTEGELGGKIMTKFVGIKAKTYSYLIDDGSKDESAKGTKNCVIEGKLNFENHKNCLEATHLENKINYLEKNKIDIDSVKEFFFKKKPILKIQQRFKRHNVFTEDIKISLSSNDDKRMQSIDSIETCICNEQRSSK